MITEIQLENFLFMHKANLVFSKGLNVITGETGAGKSVLLEAVKLLLGKKSRAGIVLKGQNIAKIQAEFDVKGQRSLKAMLDESGYSNEDDPDVLSITRTFNEEGTGRVLVNGIKTTAAFLKEVGPYLMEIHGQNEHQTLLDPDTQRELLDRTGGDALKQKLEKLKTVYKERKAILDKLEIEALVYIGGNDSMDTIKKLSDYAILTGSEIRFIGCPKTIDNDLALTDHTPGYGSAAKYIGTSVKEIIRDSLCLEYNGGLVTIVEIMGRNAGWLTGAAAISIKCDAQTGSHHGVFQSDGEGLVARFLHKQTVESLKANGAVDERGNINIDTGAVLMDSDIVNALFSLVCTNGDIDSVKFDKFVSEKSRVSFYGDFLYPLAKESTFEQYLKEAAEGEINEDLLACRKEIWDALRGFTFKLFSLSPAEFLHFGTSKELLELVTKGVSDYSLLGWKKQVHSFCPDTAASVYYSVVDAGAGVPFDSYIEYSHLHSGVKVGHNCIVSGVELFSGYIPDNTVIHGVVQRMGNLLSEHMAFWIILRTRYL